MDFAKKQGRGHVGPRKFWREYLPRLKYHNPSIPMIVNRHENNDSPPILTLYLRTAAEPSAAEPSAAEPSAAEPSAAEPSAAEPSVAAAATATAHTQLGSSRTNLSKAPPPGPGERVVHIDMKDKHSSVIFDFFMAETRAKALKPTNEEIAEMQALEELRMKAVADRERVQRLRAEKKKDEEMLRRARAAGGLGDQEKA